MTIVLTLAHRTLTENAPQQDLGPILAVRWPQSRGGPPCFLGARAPAPAAFVGPGSAVGAHPGQQAPMSRNPLIDRVGGAAHRGPPVEARNPRPSYGSAQAHQDCLRPADDTPFGAGRPSRRGAIFRCEAQCLADAWLLGGDKAQAVDAVEPSQERGARRAESAIAVEDEGDCARAQPGKLGASHSRFSWAVDGSDASRQQAA
jgi:hypothetical protein